MWAIRDMIKVENGKHWKFEVGNVCGNRGMREMGNMRDEICGKCRMREM
jgi:hypothetical protein